MSEAAVLHWVHLPSLQSAQNVGDERREDPGIWRIQDEGQNDTVLDKETEILLGIRSWMAQIAETTCCVHGSGLVFH